MKLLGIDFDNTLVNYDNLFHKVAVEKGLIKYSLPANKIAIRDYLREKGWDDQFTLLQGEVYGLRILEAEPANGAVSTLYKIMERNMDIVLISHKTEFPYKGPRYNLRQGAKNWLQKHNLYNELGDTPIKRIYFENTKKEKVERIMKQSCTHFIDDLPEILEELGGNIKKVLYNPMDKECHLSGIISISKWDMLLEECNSK